jgi:hypothetical protein
MAPRPPGGPTIVPARPGGPADRRRRSGPSELAAVSPARSGRSPRAPRRIEASGTAWWRRPGFFAAGRERRVRSDADHGRNGLADQAGIGVAESDDLLPDLATASDQLRVLSRHLGGGELDGAVRGLLLQVVDPLGQIGVAARATDEGVVAAPLVLDEAGGGAYAQELALPDAHEPARLENGLEDVAHGSAVEVEGGADPGGGPPGYRSSGRDRSVFASPHPSEQVHRVRGQALVAIELRGPGIVGQPRAAAGSGRN